MKLEIIGSRGEQVKGLRVLKEELEVEGKKEGYHLKGNFVCVVVMTNVGWL